MDDRKENYHANQLPLFTCFFRKFPEYRNESICVFSLIAHFPRGEGEAEEFVGTSLYVYRVDNNKSFPS